MHLNTCYNLDENADCLIYEEAMTLYHEINTFIDLTPLTQIDNKVLSSLIVVITYYYDFEESSQYLK
ncbi:unnamed protein product [Rotaria sp. Silwood2]|nr:unnamed protein product [Rotaria sp. Silwood2]CAF3370206.1 unnamed protein product [Rotaria sp. Silwood2]CAF4372955.1 unnamed protein product [Rotaria sp. Silwood2]CAF4417553.1 unnamed protein product [Rotaria sp. Silwood2]